ncbi:molybdopterin-dependent oxidoreductase [Dehalococcoidia bacterium]|nr:molybdopterin-dependent oxidoreductase [Dehalococcoidia bacterium]
MTQYKELGKNQARVDARDKVTGRAMYAADIYLPGMIWCKVKGSTRRHARITNIDISNASKLPGVREIICGSDFPDAFFGMGGLKDHRVMARDHVFYIGEPVAAVAADDEVTAAQAVGLIEVTYEDIDAVIDPLEAVRPESALVHPEAPGFEGYGFGMGGNINILMENDRGDVDGAFRECVHVFEDTYRSQSINQGFLEPMACVANLEPTGRLTIWASTQGPYQVRSQLASVLEMPVSKIKVVPMELGGGFGAKLRLNMEAFPALLAIKTGRPVKLVNTREEVFTLSGPRLPTNVYLKTGVAVDGTTTWNNCIGKNQG